MIPSRWQTSIDVALRWNERVGYDTTQWGACRPNIQQPPPTLSLIGAWARTESGMIDFDYVRRAGPLAASRGTDERSDLA